MRIGARLSLTLFCVALLFPATAADIPEPITLEIPQMQLQLEPNSAAVIASVDFDKLLIHIAKSPTQVSPGSLFTRINTQAANMIMTTTTTSDGILCELDLSHHEGFHLQPGRNSVEFSFTDLRTRVHYASFLLQTSDTPATRDQKRASITPDRPVAGADKFAVVVGIARYSDTAGGITSLQFADRDAQDFRDFLLSPDGGSFPKDNIRLLLNADATSQNVRSALFTFLTKAQPQDEVVLYIAGHGAPDPNDPRNLYLLTYDTKIDDMGGTAFPMYQLQDVFTRVIKAKRVVTFADTCHSYGFSGAGAHGKKSNNLVNQYLSHFANDSDRAVITASDISQLSYESDKWGGGHGVFTFFLLKGLHGEADYNKDGTVTAGELFAYIHDSVDKATEGNQSPMALPGLAEHLPLSGVGLRKSAKSATMFESPTDAFFRDPSDAFVRNFVGAGFTPPGVSLMAISSLNSFALPHPVAAVSFQTAGFR
jgi:Caspase domain